GSDIRRCFIAYLEPPDMFDQLATSRVLEPGDSLKGWMLFEWPLKMRNTTVLIKNVRLTVVNSKEEKTSTLFDFQAKPPDSGSSMLGGSVYGRGEHSEEVDLSNIPIKPVRNGNGSD